MKKYNKMFELVKSIFFATIKFLSRITGCNALKMYFNEQSKM